MRVLLIDNYDSFTWNLVHLIGGLGAEVDVWRNDALTVDEALAGDHDAIVLSPGPCTPNEAGICLNLIREGAGSNATETRWACAPVASPAADSTLHCWTLNKNKKGTTGIHDVSWNGATAAVHLVAQAGERHQPEKPPG